MKTIIYTSCFALFITGTVSAQETQHLALDIGGGWTQSVGSTGRNLDNGWNVGGGIGWNFSPYVGALVQTNYNSMGINSTTLNSVGFPGGDVHIFSATLDPIVHLHPRGRFDAYIVGGGYLAFHPGIALESLTLLVAAIFFVEGVMEIVVFFQFRGLSGSGWILFDGLVTLVLAYMIWRPWPSSSAWAIGTLLGVNLIVSGFTRLMYSVEARKTLKVVA